MDFWCFSDTVNKNLAKYVMENTTAWNTLLSNQAVKITSVFVMPVREGVWGGGSPLQFLEQLKEARV